MHVDPSKEAKKFLWSHIIMKWGVSLYILLDGGTHFSGKFQEICEILGVSHMVFSAYHPTIHGVVEPSNKLLLHRLRRW